jgi:hypothetical protein
MQNALFYFSAMLMAFLALVCLGYFFYCLRYALFMAKMRPQKQAKVFYVVVLGIIFWVTLVLLLSYTGFFSNFEPFPKPPLLILIPLPLVLWLTFWKPFEEYLKTTPSGGLIYIQSFRIVVELVLWLLYIRQWMPVQMTFIGYNFDILTGLTAPLVAYLCFTKRMLPAYISLVWNIAGLILLANVLLIAVFSMPVPFRFFMNEPSVSLVAEFPFILLPAVLVPFAYAFHIFSIRQYLLKRKMAKQF